MNINKLNFSKKIKTVAATLVLVATLSGTPTFVFAAETPENTTITKEQPTLATPNIEKQVEKDSNSEDLWLSIAAAVTGCSIGAFIVSKKNKKDEKNQKKKK